MSKTRTVRGVGWDVSALGNGMKHELASVLDVLVYKIVLLKKLFRMLQLSGVVLNWLMFLNLLGYLSTAIAHKKVENMLSL